MSRKRCLPLLESLTHPALGFESAGVGLSHVQFEGFSTVSGAWLGSGLFVLCGDVSIYSTRRALPASMPSTSPRGLGARCSSED
jgi:hypothetical protein